MNDELNVPKVDGIFRDEDMFQDVNDTVAVFQCKPSGRSTVTLERLARLKNVMQDEIAELKKLLK